MCMSDSVMFYSVVGVFVLFVFCVQPSIYCCRVSTVRVVQFSQLSSGFTVRVMCIFDHTIA